MKKIAIIVAGGQGVRMNSKLPKQFMLLKGKPVIYYSIKTFLDAYDDLDIVLVLPEEYQAIGREMVNAYFNTARIEITAGGATRFQSVKNGLKLVNENAIIFVHDGVRCLVSKELIHRCYHDAVQHGSAIPVIPSKDSVRILILDGSQSVDRSKLMLVQTPQTFQSNILQPAYQIAYQESFTDEASVVESHGGKLFLTEGEELNMKITKPIDLLVAEKILESNK